MTLQEILNYFNEGKLRGEQLAEAFARYPSFQVPVDEKGQPYIYKDAEGAAFVNAFENDAAIARFLTTWGPDYTPKTMTAMGGHQLFNLLSETTSEWVNIIPEAPQDIHYKAAQYGMLKNLAVMTQLDIVMENILQGQGDLGANLDILNAYQNYTVVIGEGKYLAMAPDDKGRKLIAIFTSNDAAMRMVDRIKEGSNNLTVPPMVSTMDGIRLFQELSTYATLEGIVFNCLGPVGPRAFVPKLIELAVSRASAQ